jgi:hypothetical protein
MVVVTTFPTFLSRYRHISWALREKNIDLNFVSDRLLSRVRAGKSSPYIPLIASWRDDGVLWFGTDSLPDNLPAMDARSACLWMFQKANALLWQLGASTGSIAFKDVNYSKKWLLKNARHYSTEGAMGPEWHDFGVRLKGEVDRGLDPRSICKLYVDLLKPRISFARFSGLDQTRYVAVNLLSRRRLLWRTFLEKTPIQERLLKALFILLKCGATEISVVVKAYPLVRDLATPPLGVEPKSGWELVRGAILRDYEAVIGLGDVILG